MQYKNFAKRLKELRKESGLTQQKLADILFVDRTSVGKWETAMNLANNEVLRRMCNLFNCSMDYLLGMTDERTSENPNRDTLPTATVKIPLLGNIAAGQPIEAVENVEDYVYISEDMARRGTYFALKVKGNSMEPRIYEGDIAIIRHQGSVNSGEIAAVKVNGDDVTLKKVEYVKDGVKLIGLNPSFTPLFYTTAECVQKPLTILGKLVEVRSAF